MSAVVEVQKRPARSVWIWFAPVQAAALFTVFAIASGGQMLRNWILGALVSLMALPLLVGLEASLFAMMLFEPFRGIIRRAQYLFVTYTDQDPIHVLTPIVTILAFAVLLRKHRLHILWASPLAGWVTALSAIYLLEVLNPLQGGLMVGLAGAMFVLVPTLWFYFGQTVDEKFISNGMKLVVALAVVTSLYGIYQMLFGYPAFEQYWIDNTDFYNSIAVGHIERALATFCSAEEWGRYVELAAIVAFGFAAKRSRLAVRASWFATGALLVGFVVLTGQRTAVFGLLAGVVALIVLGARTLPRGLARLGALAIPAVLLVVMMPAPSADEMWSNDETQTVSTVLSHTKRGVLQPAGEESFQVRLTNWAYLFTDVVPYRPLGAGTGAGTLGEARFNDDSDLPPIDSSIIVHAIAFGIPGLLLFIWIVSRSVWLSWRSARYEVLKDTGPNVSRIVAALMCALALNSMFGLTFTLYSVAPLAWLLIGWISAQAARTKATEREVFTI